MEIQGIKNIGLSLFNPIETEKSVDTGFGNIFTDLIGSVNQDQMSSEQITKDFVLGANGVELHDVMIAGEKAKTSLELLMEIRNKTVDMYKELTRMQI